MWPVAVKNELDTFCGFMGYSRSPRKVVIEGLGERVRVQSGFHCSPKFTDESQ
jgi:hypothetical protein